MAALFCAAEEGNLDGLKDLTEMAKKIDLETSNRVICIMLTCCALTPHFYVGFRSGRHIIQAVL